MLQRHAVSLIGSILVLAGCGAGDSGDNALNVTWTFASGDCESTSVAAVRIGWTLAGGTLTESEFPCVDGGGKLGEFAEGGGTYTITAEGLDVARVARVSSYGQTVTVGPGGNGGHPIDITLHPQASDVVVSWTVGGGGPCPQGVILPYFIALYRPPADVGGALTDKVTEVQESCSSGQATLANVAPGDYIVEVDSRAVTPALKNTAPVTVVAGDSAAVSVDL